MDGPLAISISHPAHMSASCPTRPLAGPRKRDGMTGMALFQGLLDREGRTLEKVRRLVESGGASLNAGAEARAANAYIKALSLLEAQTGPIDGPEEWAEACAKVGAGLLAVGHVESAQAAATEALRSDNANVRALAVQGDLLVAAGRATDAIPYYDGALRANPKAKGVWTRKGNAHASLEQRPEAIRAYIQVVNLDPDDVEGYARVLALVPEDVEMWVRKG